MDSDPFEGDELLTVRDIAKRLKVDETTVRRWIQAGVLDAVLLPQRGSRPTYRVRLSTLRRLVEGPSTLAS